ncbi:MAG: hypothetical protein AAF585_22555, partial [Verrucomicrobiota bacterium]
AHYRRNNDQSLKGLALEWESSPSRVIWFWPPARPSRFLEPRLGVMEQRLDTNSQPHFNSAGWRLEPPDSGGVLKRIDFIEYPKRISIAYRIDSLPDMPNPRSITNLFDVNIPYVETCDPVLVVSQAAELRCEWYSGSSASSVSSSFEGGLTRFDHWQTFVGGGFSGRSPIPKPQSYYNLTAFELLQKDPGAASWQGRLDVDQEAQLLRLNDDPTWTESLKTWWNKHTPEWLQFD